MILALILATNAPVSQIVAKSSPDVNRVEWIRNEPRLRLFSQLVYLDMRETRIGLIPQMSRA
jgi:hypothetical protein